MIKIKSFMIVCQGNEKTVFINPDYITRIFPARTTIEGKKCFTTIIRFMKGSSPEFNDVMVCKIPFENMLHFLRNDKYQDYDTWYMFCKKDLF